MDYDASEDPVTWELVITSQERGTKKYVNAVLGGFVDRESAVRIAEAFESQATRGGNLPVTAESPDGTRVMILANDFRSTRIQKHFLGFA